MYHPLSRQQTTVVSSSRTIISDFEAIARCPSSIGGRRIFEPTGLIRLFIEPNHNERNFRYIYDRRCATVMIQCHIHHVDLCHRLTLDTRCHSPECGCVGLHRTSGKLQGPAGCACSSDGWHAVWLFAQGPGRRRAHWRAQEAAEEAKA